jgi:hypothetical protein
MSAPTTGAFHARTSQPAWATGVRQVRAAVSALAASGGTVTWLCLCAAGSAHRPQPGHDDPVAGPLLARSEPVRVLVCAADRGPASALAGTYQAMFPGSMRVTRFGAARRGARGDLVISSRAGTTVVVTGPDGAPGAAVVAEAAVGAVMGALVDALWDTALPPASAERIDEITRDPVKLRILNLLESGAKDEAIARALGVSLRTCRRHIAELLSAADAVSRFQAASALARAGALGAACRAG